MANPTRSGGKFFFDGAQVEIGSIPIESVASTTKPKGILVVNDIATRLSRKSNRFRAYTKLGRPYGGIVVVAPGQWISGVSQYRNTNGVSNLSHNADGTLDTGSISLDKKDSVNEQWWIP